MGNFMAGLIIKRIVFVVFFIYFVSWRADADIYGIPAIKGDAKFCATGENVEVLENSYCWWDSYGQRSGMALFPAPAEFIVSNAAARTGFDSSYAPYKGVYFIRVHACPGSSAGQCTLKNSAQYVDSNKKVMLSTDKTISAQNPNFGGGSGHLNSPSSLCITFVSDDDTEWSTEAPRTCQDATRLPATPSFCYLNMGTNSDFNVDMGTIERGMISTVPGSTTKKTVPFKVMCGGDADLTATFTLQYTPITIVGSEVVSTNKTGLGVAIYLNDKLMSTKDTLTQDFSPGVTDLNLGFEVVRDPYVNIGDIDTGDFTSDAILILTKQ